MLGDFIWSLACVIGGLGLIRIGFDRFAWRWAPFKRFVARPDLQGTWAGELNSDYAGANGPIDAYVVIHQTYSTLEMRLMTRESQSVTSVADVTTESDGRYSVFSIYQNRPELEQQDRSRIHRGALQLEVTGLYARGLKGEYWTDRKTAGSLDLRLISRMKATGWEEAQAIAEVADKGRRVDRVGEEEKKKANAAVPAGVASSDLRGLVDTLARVAYEPGLAKVIVQRADFPPEYVPEFRTAQEFWNDVVRQANNGRIGLSALLEEAAGQFPSNAKLRDYARRLKERSAD